MEAAHQPQQNTTSSFWKEAQRFLGIVERLHDPLPIIYRRIRYLHASVSPQYILKIAVKVMNDTIGDNGLVPSRLVFRTIPRFPILIICLPAQRKRMKAPKSARAEINSIDSVGRVPEALTRNIVLAANQKHKPGEKVLVY